MKISPLTEEFIAARRYDDVRTLALQAGKYPDVDMKTAVGQIAGRQAVAEKIPSWYENEQLWFPPHLSLEQCSSEITATYKSALCGGKALVDMTGGFGVDCAFMAKGFSRAVYVEHQNELCEIAEHNFRQLGLEHIRVVNADGVHYLENMPPADCIFIDPARRDRHGQRTVQLSDCEPDVGKLEKLLLQKAGCVIVKLSPMLDISLALKELQHTAEVHVLSVRNECKELLLLLKTDVPGAVSLHCLNYTNSDWQKFVFTREGEKETGCSYTNRVDKYLYEPNASVLKAGGYKSIAATYNQEKLHPSSHLYTSGNYITGFPGRVFEVEAYSSVKDKTLLTGIDKANITVRNFPVPVADLRKRLKLKDGGDTYLFATTLNDNSKVLIRCKKKEFFPNK